jgi:colicin import membrane protein
MGWFTLLSDGSANLHTHLLMPPTDPDPAPAPVPPPAAPTPPPEPIPPTDPPDLGDAGKKALQAERDRAKAAEREAARLKAENETLRPLAEQAEELRKAQETEADRLKREADEGRKLAAQGAAELEQAYTITALAQTGLVGAHAQAAMRLVDGVTYDPVTHQPQNLQERLDAAKTVYGEAYFTGATPTPTPQPGDPPVPGFPAIHQGPRATPEPNEDEQFATFMRSHFPHVGAPSNSG